MPGTERIAQPNGPRRGRTVIELSLVCMTSAITVRADQPRLLTSMPRLARMAPPPAPPNFAHRGARPPPSTSSVRSRPIALEPGPYLVGSMWVWSSGWNEDVIATPREWSSPGTAARSTARIASEFVRVIAPSRADSPGRAPVAFIRCSRRCVP